MRTLKRPMFKMGGKAEVDNDGIMSGLVDREELQAGTAQENPSILDYFKSLVLGPRFTDPNYTPPSMFPKGVGTGLEFMSPESQSPGLTKIGKAIEDKKERKGPLGIDTYAKKVKYAPYQERAMEASDLQVGEGDLNLSEKELKGLAEYYKTLGVKGDTSKYTGGIPEVKTEIKVEDGDTSKIGAKDTGSNVVTQAEKNAILKARAEEFEELLNPGARKRVINNALAAASGAFGKSTGNTMQDIANAITAAAGATSEIDKTKQKAAELAIGESIQKGIAKEKYKPGNYEFLVALKERDPKTYKELVKNKDTDQDTIIAFARNYTGPTAVPKAIGDMYRLKADGAKGGEKYGGTLPVTLDKKSKTNVPDFNKMEAGKIYYNYTDQNFYKIGENGQPEVTSKPNYLK